MYLVNFLERCDQLLFVDHECSSSITKKSDCSRDSSPSLVPGDAAACDPSTVKSQR